METQSQKIRRNEIIHESCLLPNNCYPILLLTLQITTRNPPHSTQYSTNLRSRVRLAGFEFKLYIY